LHRFLLASLQLDVIAQSTTECEVKESLKQIPSDLKSTYDRTLERVGQQQEKRRNLAYRILSWLSQARRPLSVEELGHVLAIREGDSDMDKTNIPKERIMVRVCMGLVVIDHDSSAIRLAHFSMQEYLQRRFERFETKSLSAEKDMIANTCLTILLFDEFSKGYCNSDSEFLQRMKMYPELSYAAANWAYHRSNRCSGQSRQLALRFLGDYSKVTSATQAMMVNTLYQYREYSQEFPKSFTGLHMASFLGVEEPVESLLESIMVDSKDSYYRAPLSYAAQNGHNMVVELLLEKGAELESKDRYGQTPLLYAAQNRHDAVVKLLLENGAELESKNTLSGRTPLLYAAQKGHDAVVKLLLENGAELESKDRSGRTPLSWAAQKGHDAVVKLLLENGAELESKDTLSGQTPLSWAAENGHDAVVKLLLERAPTWP
jgi:ankyrin repeat protein